MEFRRAIVDVDMAWQLARLVGVLMREGSKLSCAESVEMRSVGNRIWLIADEMDAKLRNVLPFGFDETLSTLSTQPG
jgi:hypothetical protein